MIDKKISSIFFCPGTTLILKKIEKSVNKLSFHRLKNEYIIILYEIEKNISRIFSFI